MNALEAGASLLIGLLMTVAQVSRAQVPGSTGGRGPIRGSVTMVFGGDCVLAEHFREYGDSIEAFGRLAAFREADVAMVNLECPVTRRGSPVEKPFNFRMPPEALSQFREGGVDLVNLANNHVFDYGEEGLFDTISYLDSAGVRHVGAGRNLDEARRPVVIECRGWRIGFLGYYGGKESPVATENGPGVAEREIRAMAGDIARLRSIDSVDYVVVNLHWGTELAEAPDPSQQRQAHELIDAGADAIIGHHPHVLQGIERYKSGVIAYSLGNLIFGGNARDTYRTGLLKVSLGPWGTEYGFIPVGVDRWQAAELAGTDSLAVIRLVQQRSSEFHNTIFTR